MALGALTRSFQRWRRNQNDLSRYEVCGFNLHLPTEHALPRYQAAHRLYDRFLCVLGDCLPEDSIVIDIGANIGDSAAALCGTGRKRVICVEGNPYFFQLLAKNAQLIEARGHRIVCVSAIVGPEQASGFISESGSTGKTVLSDRGISMTSLDRIAETSYPGGCWPTLIKVDTDGYDAVVLASGRRTIAEHQPVLFWENEISSVNNLKEYLQAYSLLEDLGYTNYTVFDNFGNIMFETADRKVLCDMARYIAILNAGLSTRTIYYADILASADRHRDLHSGAVESYQKLFDLIPGC